MTHEIENPVFSDLPDVIPVFPLSGVLLLPRGYLPLNIFEPRYKAMISDALAGNRLIGMVQPRTPENENNHPALFDTGCAGRITSYNETDDGRYVVTLTGLCRFRLRGELPPERAYRRVQADWSPFVHDFESLDRLDVDRARLRAMLADYFDMQGMSCDWDAVDGATDARLMTCLPMICPFGAGEKQALLETVCPRERAGKFMSLLMMAVQTKRAGDCGGCH